MSRSAEVWQENKEREIESGIDEYEFHEFTKKENEHEHCDDHLRPVRNREISQHEES